MYSGLNFVQISVHVSLLVLGVIKNPKHRIAYIACIISIDLFLILGTVVGFLACREIHEKLEVISAVLPITTILFIFIDFFTRSETVVKYLKRLKGNQHSDYIFQQANTKVKNDLMRYLTIMTVFFFLSFTIPFIYYAIPGVTITDKNSLLVTYWFSCGDTDGQGTNATWKSVCLPLRTRGQFILANSYILAGLSVIGLTAFSELTIYGVSINELSIHVEIFKFMIHDLTRIMHNFYENPDIEGSSHNKALEHELNVSEQFLKIIKYQQFIKSLTFETIRIWNTYNTLYVCHMFVVISLMLLFIVKEKDQELLLAFKMICVSGMVFVGFVYLCQCGHVISRLNEIMFNELCTVPWYYQNTQFCKLYAIMLTQNLIPVHFKMLGTYEINLNTIFSLLKTSYSMLNAFLLMSK